MLMVVKPDSPINQAIKKIHTTRRDCVEAKRGANGC